jgi:hypothetical protein
MRIDKGNGIKFVTLLWPRAEHWPPEIDFAEDGGGQRKAITSTVIWGTAADKQQQQIRAEADFSDWHTVSVEWSPKKVVFLLDGHVTGTVTDDRAVIPHEPMWLGIQTEQVACSQWTTCVDSTTPANVDMQIDWAAQYTADSSVGAGGGSGSGTKATSKHSLVKAVYYKPAPGASRVRLRGAHVPHKRFKVIVVGKHHVHRTRYAVNQAERAKARKVRDGVYAFRLRPHQLEAGKNVLRLSVAAPKQAKTKMKVRFHY